ncbi:BolA family transcriptional regulator [Oecophyllibacter saccharovorans]|nr:BolA family transcriptional regulator [Oecophyllibacter saccharovorans]
MSLPPSAPGQGASSAEPLNNSTRKDRMHALLQAALNPARLEIRDTSARHSKHVEMRQEQTQARGPHQKGQTHYEVTIIAEKFDGMPLLARHRFVQELLAEEFATGLHALQLHLRGEKTS